MKPHAIIGSTFVLASVLLFIGNRISHTLELTFFYLVTNTYVSSGTMPLCEKLTYVASGIFFLLGVIFIVISIKDVSIKDVFSAIKKLIR